MRARKYMRLKLRKREEKENFEVWLLTAHITHHIIWYQEHEFVFHFFRLFLPSSRIVSSTSIWKRGVTRSAQRSDSWIFFLYQIIEFSSNDTRKINCDVMRNEREMFLWFVFGISANFFNVRECWDIRSLLRILKHSQIWCWLLTQPR